MSITELKEFAKIVERQTECKSNFENLIKKQDDLIKLSNDLIKKLDEEKELHKQIAELFTFYFITNSFILSTSLIILIFSTFFKLVGLSHCKDKNPTI